MKTNFERLEIYQLAEKLSDRVWEIVYKRNYLAIDTVGKQLIRATDSMARTLRKGAVEEATRTFFAFSKSVEARYMNRSTGFGGLTGGSC